MAANDVKKFYQDIISEVCSSVKEALQEEGFDDQTLKDLKKTWLDKLDHSRALEPVTVSAAAQALNREYPRSATGDTTNNRRATAAATEINRIHPTTNTAVSNYTPFIPTTSSTAMNTGILSIGSQGQAQFPRPNYSAATNITNSAVRAPNQVDGAFDELIRKKKSKKTIEISLQVDGTGPPMGDDDDDDDSEIEGNDVNDDLDDDDDDDGNEESREELNPLCSDDDVSDDEPERLFDTDNIVLCQYDKITRTKNKWRFTLKSGVMSIEGRDYVFSKATGEADW